MTKVVIEDPVKRGTGSFTLDRSAPAVVMNSLFDSSSLDALMLVILFLVDRPRLTQVTNFNQIKFKKRLQMFLDVSGRCQMRVIPTLESAR